MDKVLYKNILIYSYGNIGDLLMCMPAYKAIRDNFKDSNIDIIAVGNKSFQTSFLKELGIFNNIFFMPTDPCGGFIRKNLLRLKIILKILSFKYDSLFFMPSQPRVVDIILFNLASFKNFVVLSDFSKEKGGRRVFEIFLDGLKTLGLDCDTSRGQLPDFNFTEEEKARAKAVFKTLNVPEGKKLFSLGIGANSPARKWPLERYKEVLNAIVSKYNLFPIVIASPNERVAAEEFVHDYGGAVLTAGNNLSAREMICSLADFKFHLGNDTGTIHMAASVGVPCVGLYTAANAGRLFYPYGEKNQILQKNIDCKGCVCAHCCKKEPALCLSQITTDEVIKAVELILSDS